MVAHGHRQTSFCLNGFLSRLIRSHHRRDYGVPELEHCASTPTRLSACFPFISCTARWLEGDNRCNLDPHAVVVAWLEVLQRLTRRLLHGLLVGTCQHGLDEGGGIALRLEGLEQRDSGTCFGSRL
jgi:hypothetical protein